MGWFRARKTTEYLQLSVFAQEVEMSLRTKLAIALPPRLRTVSRDFSFRIKQARTQTAPNLSPKAVTSLANSLLNPGVLASSVEDAEKVETHGLKEKHTSTEQMDRSAGTVQTQEQPCVCCILQRGWERANRLSQAFKLTLISPMRLHLQEPVPSKHCAVTINQHMNSRRTHLDHSGK